MKKVLYIFIGLIFYVCLVLVFFYAKNLSLKPKYDVLGVTTVQQENSNFFVEMNGVRYVCNRVYTGKCSHSNAGQYMQSFKITAEPSLGLTVTCFKPKKHSVTNFIVGDYTPKELTEFFEENSDEEFCLILIFVSIGMVLILLKPVFLKMLRLNFLTKKKIPR